LNTRYALFVSISNDSWNNDEKLSLDALFQESLESDTKSAYRVSEQRLLSHIKIFINIIILIYQI
jgi:hypothetical protein